MNEQTKIVNNVMMYMYNVSPYDVFNAVYGEGHDSHYAGEKMDLMNDFGRFWGGLDDEHRSRLVQAAQDRYAK